MYAKHEVRKPLLYWNLLSNTLYYRIIHNPALLEETLKAEGPTDGLVIIDEIQRVPQLLYTVHQFIEDTDLVFLMTGSSVRKLKTGCVNLLGGRALEKKLHPLCYPEIKNRGDYTLERIFKTGLLHEMYLYQEDAEEALEAYEGLYLENEIQSSRLHKLPREGCTIERPAAQLLSIRIRCRCEPAGYKDLVQDSPRYIDGEGNQTIWKD